MSLGRRAGGSAIKVAVAALLAVLVCPVGWGGLSWAALNREEQKVALREIKERERSIITQLDELDRKRINLKQTRQRLEAEIRALSGEEEEAEKETADLEVRRGILNQSLRQRIKALYLHGRNGPVRLSLAADSVKEAVLGRSCLVRIVEFDLKLMEDYNILQKELDGLKKALALRKKKMSGLIQEMARADLELASQRSARARLLLEVDRNREVQQKAQRELDRAAGELDQRLVSLEESIPQGVREDAPGFLAVGKGSLSWPVQGKLGRMADRKRKGVLIRTREGSPVRAVGAGRVIHAGWIKGYGLVVILDHGARYYSLTAHLEEIGVKTGERVEGGRVIGTSGRAGLAPPGVYFEIRRREKALDTGEWLRASSG